MLELPQVSLLMIETMDHELARLAVEDCMSKCVFGDVVICTDKPELFEPLNARYVVVDNWPSKLGWSKFFWNGVVPHIRTSHVLGIQWDSGVWLTEMWQAEYLEYDYVGAPWTWHPTKRVGNGGFSLRSMRLLRYMTQHRDQFPITTHVDDDLVCRKYRPQLEEAGLTWAPERVASDFAFECSRPSPESRHFGFHGCFNFGVVFNREQVLERARLMKASPYISQSYMWQNFCKACPDIVAELEEKPAGRTIIVDESVILRPAQGP